MEALAYLQRLESFSGNAALREGVRIHFRIFATVDGQRINFIRGGAEPAGAK
jgi:hypothetical protein